MADRGAWFRAANENLTTVELSNLVLKLTIILVWVGSVWFQENLAGVRGMKKDL